MYKGLYVYSVLVAKAWDPWPEVFYGVLRSPNLETLNVKPRSPFTATTDILSIQLTFESAK